MQVQVKVLFFAKARELSGFKENTVTVPANLTYNQLLHLLVKSFNLHLIQNNILIALNEEYCSKADNISLKPGDIIAIIPPLSGDNIYNLVLAPDCGAVSLFVGTTRDNFEGKIVTSLEYEAYASMGFKAMEQICSDLRKQWPDVRNIAIYHKLGPVLVKEASIVIAASSPHRADAIKAVEWCIDNVKKTVPIFKKEIYSEGDSQWKENAELLLKPNKLPKLANSIEPEVIITPLPRHLVQIKATNAEINVRIEKFMERKRCEINLNNIRDFCFRHSNVDMEYSCARIDSKILKRKDSKGYLEVDRVYNNYVRDQDNFDFLLKFITKDGVNERLNNLESQLNMSTPVLPTVYKRIKNLEDRLLHLESISPEYIKFWDTRSKNTKSKKRKMIFSVDDIDSFINELEKQRLH